MRLSVWFSVPKWQLCLVAIAFLVVQIAVVSPAFPLAYDEAVYASQASGHAPPATFSAPRARGITYLGAPVTLLTSSVAVLRVYFAVLSTLALFGAYALWLLVYRSRLVPLAALLFAGLWTTVFYGPAEMPNLWLALCAVAATALTVLAAREPRHWGKLAALAAVLAVSALLRPTDSALLAGVLVAGLLWARRRALLSCALPLLAVAIGTAAGWAQWVVEAEQRYGGTLNRLRAGAKVQGSEPTFSGGRLLRSVNGPVQCVPCDAGEAVSFLEAGLWVALAGFTILGVILAHRQGLARPLVLAAAVAGALTFPYVFLIPFAAPRFLLPAYALLALPCAAAILLLPEALRRRRFQLVTRASLAVAVLGYLVAQQVVLAHVVNNLESSRSRLDEAAGQLRRLGVRPPCLITGSKPIEVAYLLGCESTFGKPLDAAVIPDEARLALGSKRVTAVAHGPVPPGSFLASWTKVPLEDGSWAVYLPPGTLQLTTCDKEGTYRPE